MKRDYSILGMYFKEAREKAGYTQKQISDKLGYSSAQFVSNMERGLCHLPLKAMRRLIDLYELDRNEVLKAMLAQQEDFLRHGLFGEKSKRRAR
jgi:transcriptional regulator with XRE-family HTH domain